ncbi:MAG: peptidylprolyl isomerase [Bacteroidales bacterium]
MALITMVAAFCMFAPVTAVAQQGDDVLLTIGNENITVDEFMAVYQKNNVEGEVLDKKSLEEYLDLYINFKLKVKAAEDMGLDTVASFINELKGYRDQLAKPYFVDEEVNAALLEEAYQRKNTDIRVSHILIRLEKYATPADTLEAYNKITEIRKRIVEGGEDFNAVAEEVSEDPTARDMPARGFQPPRKGNRGDIGYFSVFDMVYPFEDAAYKLDVGEVSEPVRTDFGYHLILVHDKKPALGKVQVAHLFLQMPKEATAEDSVALKAHVDSLYTELKNGAEWDEIVREYSDDKSSSMNKGVLPWFGANRMVPQFIDGIRSIPDSGQISQPILTTYGWHIIKLIDTKPIGSFEDEKADLKQNLSKDVRSDKSKASIIRRIKKEYGYKQYPKAVEAMYTAIDSSIYKRKWEAAKAEGLNDPVFSIGDLQYTQADFAAYLEKHQSISSNETIDNFMNTSFEEFAEEKLLDYEDARLEQKYPEFRELIKEYRDGILLFELTDQMVWSKAIRDTTGLKSFHEKNKKDYMWGERVEATLVTALTMEGAEKALQMARDGKSGEEISEAFEKDTVYTVAVITKKFPRGENSIIDQVKWKKGITDIHTDDKGKSGFAIISGTVEPEPKTLSEARGLITADYQNYLEEQWIKDLKEKYTVTVHEDVLSQIK